MFGAARLKEGVVEDRQEIATPSEQHGASGAEHQPYRLPDGRRPELRCAEGAIPPSERTQRFPDPALASKDFETCFFRRHTGSEDANDKKISPHP